MSKKSKLKIGNAGGYWGDDPTALKRQIEGGPLDYVTMDFLAEITMSIMQKQRSRDPELGYARDFLPMLESVLPTLLISPHRFENDMLYTVSDQGHIENVVTQVV